jgi:phenylacetyl-CoA:acceptor oxidoreductase 26-kDa subunit
MILREAKGIPAWRAPQIVPLIIATGLVEGSGLFLIASAFVPAPEPVAQVTAVAAVILAALRSLSWRSYMSALAATGAPTRSLAVLAAFRWWFFVFGSMAPMALIVLGFVAPATALPLFATAGLCLFASGVAMKFVLITRAGFNQGFALTHTPVRGSGAAGPAIKPGWTLPPSHA